MNKFSVAASACIVVLAGCGGGGGGDSTTATVEAPTTIATTVSGFASKGTIKQAKVLVCRIVNGSPEADPSCAVGSTDRNGFYSVTMSDGYAGPAMVKVMTGAGSTMMDETTGTEFPYGMTMRALVPAISATTTAHVTPFSEMAAQAMSLSMPMDATKMSQAIAAVQTAMTNLGIDLSVMPMMDLKNDGANAAALGAEANLVKQLAGVAMAAKNSGTLTDANGVPCNAAGTTVQQQFACAVAAMDRVMTGYVSYDATGMAALLAALNAQGLTAVTMPMRAVDGSVGMQTADMTSMMSLQTAMENAGMTPMSAAMMVNAMMGGMH